MKLLSLFLNLTPASPTRVARLLWCASLALSTLCWIAPARAQETPPGAPPGASAGAERGGEPAHKEENKISIEQPTWITPLLKQFWRAGGAEVTADGSDASASELVGKKVSLEYEDEDNGQKVPVQATITKVGDAKPTNGAKVERASADGREVTLVNPTVTFPLAKAFPEQIVIGILTAICMLLVGMWMVRGMTRVPSRRQVVAEAIYGRLEGEIRDLIGPHYKRYMPLILTLFLYIFVMNVVGIIPGWKSPTSNVNVTAALALTIIVFVQFEGIRVNGVGGYLKHFVGEPVWLAPLNFPLHIIGEFAKLLSLTIRLFGNIFGEDVVIVILTALGIMFTRGFIPFQFPMYFFAIFTSLVQAMVFSILTCIYIALMTTHEDHSHSHGHDHHHGDDGGHIEESAGYAPATPA